MKKFLIIIAITLLSVFLISCEGNPLPTTSGIPIHTATHTQRPQNTTGTSPSETEPTLPPNTSGTSPSETEPTLPPTTVPDATNPPIVVDAALVQRIYEGNIDYPSRENYNRTNIINMYGEYVSAIDPALTQTFKIRGTEYSINYDSTIFYATRGQTVDLYTSDLLSGVSILIKQDGSLYAILGNFITINISDANSIEEVKTVLESEIIEWLNPANYAYLYIDAGEYISYFTYYNMVDGYVTNYASVYVRADGTISGLWIIDRAIDGRDLTAKDYAVNIEHNIESALIDLKMKDVFNTDTSQLQKYELSGTPHFVVYGDELCVEYALDVTTYLPQEDQIIPMLYYIYIPVDIMTAA